MLVNRNIIVGGHRTSIRLEPEFWEALAEIAEREGQTIHHLCTEIDRAARELSRTAAVRIFVVAYLARALLVAEEPQTRAVAAAVAG